MCGIVGGIAEREISPILLEGLKRLEYRGYDSAGMAVMDVKHNIHRLRRLGKVKELAGALESMPLHGHIGIAHTRWATHGAPSENNAHPHMSGEDIGIVHNGIIENYESLRNQLKQKGYIFSSETDTEVIVHLIHEQIDAGNDLLSAVKKTIAQLKGAYALGVIASSEPEKLIAAREGSPLVIGLGIGENFIGSDQLALLPVTSRFVFMEEGDIAVIKKNNIEIFNADGEKVERKIVESESVHDTADKGEYRHYMLKEIFEQPNAIRATLKDRLTEKGIAENLLPQHAHAMLDKIEGIQIIACGTSYHSGSVARYWFEQLAEIPCQVEVASEYRYRKSVVRPNTLFVTISQSGETADTLAALKGAKGEGYAASIAICNVPGSSLVRESDFSIMTHAGTEIGVASTKAFTTQLVALMLLVIELGKRNGLQPESTEALIKELRKLPVILEATLNLDKAIEKLAEKFGDKHHALFLGRGAQYPIAQEGALKLKEISYIHAEAYPAGELKHGPLALVDNDMPVIAIAPNSELHEKLKSNLEEVRARGGELYIFADKNSGFKSEKDVHVLEMPEVSEVLAPIVYTLPLQLLSYHVAVIKGTDVDQPRNLAKSVTVE